MNSIKQYVILTSTSSVSIWGAGFLRAGDVFGRGLFPGGSSPVTDFIHSKIEEKTGQQLEFTRTLEFILWINW